MDNTIVLSSVTYAVKGQKLLSQYGITSSLTRAGNVRAVKGCGYGLRIYGDMRKAASLLKGEGIKIIGYTEDRTQ